MIRLRAGAMLAGWALGLSLLTVPVARAAPAQGAMSQDGLSEGSQEARPRASAPVPADMPEPPPNVLLIMVDDLGPEWISCYGGEGIQTPAIDALAASGMSFRNAWSMPQCTPTRVTLLTGQYPFRHGWVNHWDVPRWGAGCHFDPERSLTFAEVLRGAGYATAIAGKWQINDFRVQPKVLDEHGFDEWLVWTGYETGNPPSAERYWNPYLHSNTGSKTHEGQFSTTLFVDFLIDFLQRHRAQPQLLYFPMALTHGPLTSTPGAPEAEGKMDRHRAMVREVDSAVGRLQAALRQLELTRRTVVLFTTDNGSDRGITGRMDGRDVRGGKASLGDNGVRQPFVLSWPGRIAEGRWSEALVDFSDLMPTLAELAGTTLPADAVIDGRSFAGVLDGTDPAGPREWILSMGFGPARLDEHGVAPQKAFADRALRDPRFKLWVQDRAPSHLFDLIADPGEQVDLLHDPRPEVVAARRRLESVLASFPERDARPQYSPTPPQPWDRRPKGEGGAEDGAKDGGE